MRRILKALLDYYRKLVGNIAFIPTLMSVSGLVLAIIVLYVEYNDYTAWWSDNVPFLLVKGADNARMILTTIIGGVLSLTVFSFSMVMVVLNRATASLSPRVLPQLIAKKSHQFVLGFNMGTIIYSLILIINVDNDKGIPSLAILLSMIFTIMSLGLFIYFINSISMSIQVDNILKDVFILTEKQIKQDAERVVPAEIISQYTTFISSGKKIKVYAEKEGYYKLEDLTKFLKKFDKKNVFIEIYVNEEEYVASGSLLYSYVGDEDLTRDIVKLKKCFMISSNCENTHSYYFGIRKMSEIAVKALSPGINDPGTAFRSIRLLSQLFQQLAEVPTLDFIDKSDSSAIIVLKKPEFDLILDQNITPIRIYADQSIAIYSALVDFFNCLLQTNSAHNDVINKHYEALMITIEDNVKNRVDLERLKPSLKLE